MSDRKLLTEWLAFDYSPEQIKESRDLNNGKIIMKGILQKANTLNQNGRIYPLEILEREVRNYQKSEIGGQRSDLIMQGGLVPFQLLAALRKPL